MNKNDFKQVQLSISDERCYKKNSGRTLIPRGLYMNSVQVCYGIPPSGRGAGYIVLNPLDQGGHCYFITKFS